MNISNSTTDILVKQVQSNEAYLQSYKILLRLSVMVLATGHWFSLGTPDSSTNKTDRHDITEILLKVALNIISLTLTLS